jgi:hypothetical protein
MNKCLNCQKDVKNKFCNVSCQNSYQNAQKNHLSCIRKKGEFKKFIVFCFKCNKKIKIKEREKIFPSKAKYYCSRKCANSHILNDFVKNKISNSLKKSDKVKRTKIVNLNCLNCNALFIAKEHKKRKFCSSSCSSKYRYDFRNAKYEEMILKSSLGGRNSAAKQIKRSKNEIYFYKLCKNQFKIVFHNKTIFNGWDADVIIEDFKIAILWNGPWHYKKITEKHSLKQVQNRDAIKINEIQKCNYTAYIIKDDGKFNKNFVEQKFKEFLAFLQEDQVIQKDS